MIDRDKKRAKIPGNLLLCVMKDIGSNYGIYRLKTTKLFRENLSIF